LNPWERPRKICGESIEAAAEVMIDETKGQKDRDKKKHYIGHTVFVSRNLSPDGICDQLHQLGLHFYAGSRFLQYQSPSGLFKMFD